MKTLAFITALACLPMVQLSAQPARSTPRLVGIVNLPERKSVLLEIGGSRPGSSRLTVLSEGERDAFVDVELLRFNAEHGSVELRVAKTNVVVMQAASTYANMSGRKLKQANWPRDIPNPNFFFKNQTPLTKAEMIYAFDMMFELSRLKMVPDGDEFLKPELIRLK